MQNKNCVTLKLMISLYLNELILMQKDQGQFYTALIFIVSECVVGLLLTPVCLKINRFVGCY